eukprot:GHVU01094915.1.p1 GENE.GHVU01094915.1~~GHVU01094915.1.p1  ORF type:complete len:194 (+),score=16.23 GHVU01094915.1:314-895(+)
MVGLVETSMIGRAAEALRRRETGKLLIGVAASDQIYRSTTSQNQESCQFHATAQAALAAGTALPGISSNKALRTTVEKVLQSLSVRQAVNLDTYQLGEFEHNEEDDREMVNQAIRTGIQNPATYKILYDSLCLDPRQTAETRVQNSWPSTSTSPEQMGFRTAPVIVHTPPVGQEVTVTHSTEPEATFPPPERC